MKKIATVAMLSLMLPVLAGCADMSRNQWAGYTVATYGLMGGGLAGCKPCAYAGAGMAALPFFVK